jgi:hypothetical protein
MIRSISYEQLDKTGSNTNILLRFEDTGINTEQYTFLKDRLDNFNLILDSEYSIAPNSNYDASKKIYFIEMILSISDLLKPKDTQLEQIINDHSYRFINFYERNIQSFKSNNGTSRVERIQKISKL